MNKLDIVIIQYNESFKTLKPMLDSLKLQQAIDIEHDFKVIICNIGGKNIQSDIDAYKHLYEIEYHHKDGIGNISATRKWGFELGTAPYVMFCDCDDMFYNMVGIHTILYQIQENEFDVLYSNFYEQHEDMKLFDRERDSICVHGKVFRRKFLIDNKIEWNSNLIYHEDNPFCRLALHTAKKVVYIPRGFYLWKWHEGSITRTREEWLAETYPMLIDGSEYLVTEFLKRGNIQDATWYAMLMIQEGYFFLNSVYFSKPKCQELRPKAIERYKEYYNKYKTLANSLDEKRKSSMLEQLNQQVTFANKITFDEWINEIQSTVNK